MGYLVDLGDKWWSLAARGSFACSAGVFLFGSSVLDILLYFFKDFLILFGYSSYPTILSRCHRPIGHGVKSTHIQTPPCNRASRLSDSYFCRDRNPNHLHPCRRRNLFFSPGHLPFLQSGLILRVRTLTPRAGAILDLHMYLLLGSYSFRISAKPCSSHEPCAGKDSVSRPAGESTWL